MRQEETFQFYKWAILTQQMLYILFSVCYICQQSGIHVPPIIRRKAAKKEGQTIMERILAAMLALCLCAAGVAMAQEETEEWAAGDVVVFGSYEQDNVLTNGKEPLEWIVLKTEGGTLKLRGENFDVNKVDLDAGTVEVKGSVLSLIRGKTSLAKRLFR